jgi:L-rhamnose mutarotase
MVMNTTGNSNPDRHEKNSVGEKIVLTLLRLALPPHVDNEQAAEFLRTRIGQDNKWIEWVAVRPDSLIDEDEVTDYEIHPSPIRSALFNSGKTSRINVGHFMAELVSNDETFRKWKGQMPVIYNKSSLT